MSKIRKKEKNKQSKFDKYLSILSEAGIFIFFMITTILVMTNLLFVLKISITKLHLPLLSLVSIIIYLIFKKENLKKTIIVILISIFITVLSTIIVDKIYDSTADGNTYHKLAVGALKNGWNPVYESIEKFNKKNKNPFNILSDNVNTKWVNHYARATETFAAVVYKSTGSIESGKVFNLLWIYIGVFVLFFILKQINLTTMKSLILSAIMAINPIIITHITNYYLDGVLAISLFIIIFICSIKVKWEKEKYKNINYLLLAMSIIWCINSKFTGLVYAAIFAGVLYLYRHIHNFMYEKKMFKKNLLKDTVFYIITVFISIVVVGSSTYTKNFITHGHPFYPLYGKGHVQNMVRMEIPKSIQNYSNGKLFILSIFSMGENVSPSYESYVNNPELKIPFTLSKREIANYNTPDIRIGGFGPWFSGIFILTIISTIYILIKLFKNRDYDKLILYLILLVVSFSLVSLLDGSYWARYIPYIYLLPIYSLIGIDYIGTKKINKYYFIIMTILLSFNSIIILLSQAKYTYSTNRYIKKHINNFKVYSIKQKEVPIKLYHNGVQGVQYNLDDININNYVLTNNKNNKRIGYNFYY